VTVVAVVSDGGRPSTVVAIAVARFKRFEIQTHYFSTLDGICWTTF